MQASPFQKIMIIIKIALLSMKDSLRVIYGAIFYKDNRLHASKVIHSWARRMLRLVRVNYKILNPHNFKFDPKRPYIIMSNHLSHYDIPLIYDTFPNDIVGMIAKKELFRIPFFGWGMKLGNCITIDRKNKRQAIKDLENAKQAMLKGVRAWIAPEGTRSVTGEMGPFKKGGFKIALGTKAIIVPVTIIGSNNILPTKTFDFSVDEKVEIHVGKPIDTSNYELTDLKKLMADVAKEITSKLEENKL